MLKGRNPTKATEAKGDGSQSIEMKGIRLILMA